MNNLFQFNTDFLSWQLQHVKPLTFAERLAQIQAPHLQEKVEDPIKKIIQYAIQACCTIYISSPNGSWTGSGFHIGNGYIASAAHVLPPELTSESGSQIDVSFDGKTLYSAMLAASEPNYDCAVCYCEQIINTIPPVLIGDSDQAQVGDIIAVIGNPQGFTDTATVGRISKKNAGLAENSPSPAWSSDLIIIDADIQPGASGGMVILTSGEVIGSVMGVTGDHADVGIGERMICPSNKLKEVLERLK